jgi:hypothetical protein
MHKQTKFGYRNKHTKEWLYLGEFFKAFPLDFCPEVLYNARNILEDDFDVYARCNNLVKEDWELLSVEVEYKLCNE